MYVLCAVPCHAVTYHMLCFLLSARCSLPFAGQSIYHHKKRRGSHSAGLDKKSDLKNMHSHSFFGMEKVGERKEFVDTKVGAKKVTRRGAQEG